MKHWRFDCIVGGAVADNMANANEFPTANTPSALCGGRLRQNTPCASRGGLSMVNAATALRSGLPTANMASASSSGLPMANTWTASRGELPIPCLRSASGGFVRRSQSNGLPEDSDGNILVFGRRGMFRRMLINFRERNA